MKSRLKELNFASWALTLLTLLPIQAAGEDSGKNYSVGGEVRDARISKFIGSVLNILEEISPEIDRGDQNADTIILYSIGHGAIIGQKIESSFLPGASISVVDALKEEVLKSRECNIKIFKLSSGQFVFWAAADLDSVSMGLALKCSLYPLALKNNATLQDLSGKNLTELVSLIISTESN